MNTVDVKFRGNNCQVANRPSAQSISRYYECIFSKFSSCFILILKTTVLQCFNCTFVPVPNGFIFPLKY